MMTKRSFFEEFCGTLILRCSALVEGHNEENSFSEERQRLQETTKRKEKCEDKLKTKMN